MVVLLKAQPMFQKYALSNWIKSGSSIDELYRRIFK
jgi:hypothetical protein